MKQILRCRFIILLLTVCNLQAQIPTQFGGTSMGYKTIEPVVAPSAKAAMTADLNNDTYPDVVIANSNYNSGFSVLMNQGNGTFSAPVSYTTGFESFDITVADFNNDSMPDVVVSNTGSSFTGNSVSLFTGNGNGAFAAPVNFSTGNGPVGLAAADFNVDGYMDLAVANNGGFQTGTSISILINNTNGGFLSATTITGIPMPYKLAAGFLDNDSLPDIVTANEQEMITVLMNNGNGFTQTNYTMQATQFNNNFMSIQLSDIDNDSDLDVFYSSMGTYQIALRRNLGNGILDSIQTILMDNIYGGTSSFAINDLNGDGLKDILANKPSGTAGDGYRFVINQGNGTFGQEVSGTGGQYTYIVLASDVDLDGDSDILTVDYYSNMLTVSENNGSGIFPLPVQYSTGFPIISTKTDAADIDNDGDLDILTSADSRTAINVPVAVSLNNGAGVFSPAVQITSGGMGGTGAKFRDINNDGFQDVVFASGINTTPYDFFTCINTGNGTFAAPVRWSMNSCGWNDIDAADLDNDGDLDVILSEWLGCPSVPLSARRLFISYNQGNGNYSAPSISIVNVFPGPIALCDFNEDGFVDIATGNATTVDIALNNQSGSFGTPVSFTMSQSPYDILAADFNNDGHIDVASCNYGSNPGDYNLTVRLGNGNGTLQSLQLLDAAYSPDLANVSGIASGDVDNDGDLDIIVGQNASNDMSIYINDGAGQFSFSNRLAAYYSFRSPWFADFNGDGKGDLAALISLPPSGLSSALTILPGITTGILSGGAGLSGCNAELTGMSSVSDHQVKSVIAPNPFNNQATLFFTTEAKGDYTVKVYNAVGQCVKEEFYTATASGKHQLSINRNQLHAGYYMIHISGAGYNSNVAFEIID